jgi:hypothetical protein
VDTKALLDAILGPQGLLVALVIALVALARDHQRRDRRTEAQLDRQMDVNELLADSIPGLATAVNDAMKAGIAQQVKPPTRTRRRPRTT